MVFYSLEFSKESLKFLDKVPEKDRIKILSKIELLTTLSTGLDIKKLKGSENYFRLRVGNYRIIYRFNNDILLIVVLKIGHRKDVYK